VIVWNGDAWGGPEKAMLQVYRAASFDREVNLFMVNQLPEFLYFPHTYMSLPTWPEILPIEHIIHGAGTVEGLPEGVEPSYIDLNELDHSIAEDWIALVNDYVVQPVVGRFTK